MGGGTATWVRRGWDSYVGDGQLCGWWVVGHMCVYGIYVYICVWTATWVMDSYVGDGQLRG